MRVSQRRYGGKSAQQRREARRTRLLDAAMDAMCDNAWRTVTVDKLCAAAGLNKRYFYENFTDLDAVAGAVVDGIAGDVSAATLCAVARSAEQPLDVQTRAAIDALVHTLTDDPRRARVLLGGVAGSPAQHEHRAAVMRGLTKVLVGQARNVHGVEFESDPLAQVAPAFLVGGTADAILAFVDGRAKVSRDQLIDSLATLWLITGNGAADIARTRHESR
ncbi:TetR/AcrR family transcriptional regulator [Mycolicibacterium goodii]|uniref:TetR/AcrR family transcriptional regulator n=1 Tax=Mycolicibacterium goodii TaxID=134601 RepID=UPI001F042442|nr:TetR/AcrR family transcriptional regulator [Mycolicibacterium goodii]ULN48817.1 TetR/AcrR family transcriptional regulator [Mycolicibacterium goodii]